MNVILFIVFSKIYAIFKYIEIVSRGPHVNLETWSINIGIMYVWSEIQITLDITYMAI